MRFRITPSLKILIVLTGLAAWFYLATITSAQANGDIQEIRGEINPGAVLVYQLPNLQKGETLYANAAGTLGNLDPLLVLVVGDADPVELRQQFSDSLEDAISAGEDPALAVTELANEMYLAWDDDSGRGYASSLSYEVSQNGTYLLAIAASPLSPSSGSFRLLVGIDEPDVLAGNAEPNSDILVIFQEDISRVGKSIQEINGSLSIEAPYTVYNLRDFRPDESLFVYIEATSGDLYPVMVLEDYGNKPIRSANSLGDERSGSLQLTFDEEARNYQLRISSCCEAVGLTSGEYRLLVGVNAPEVLSGSADQTGLAIIKEPIEVQIGIKLQQISSVDQKAENFGVVATMRMEWQDPTLAFSPDSCQCNFKLFQGSQFVTFVNNNDIPWPEFTILNQQGRRDTQNQLFVIFPDGQATYLERFSATLQAPDFDFRRFPFDSQKFFIRIDSLFPEEFFTFADPPELSELGGQLGEEEWIITDFNTEITTAIESTNRPSSRFSYGFEAKRHVSFYVIRVFIPILVIISVSWITFFLKDYSKRVDVSAGNLLLFIAFNFTISGDLPRLGYLTFLDTVLITTFVVTGLVVALNVILKRLELGGREELATKIDRFTIWLYPLAYILGLVLVTFLFT